MHVVYAKKVKRITLERVLVSKIVFELETVTISDLMCLFDNVLYLQDMVKNDENFKRKFGSSLEDLALILRNSRITNNPSQASLRSLQTKLKALDHFYIPHRNLTHTLKYFHGKFTLTQGTKLGIPTGKLPLVRRIGVGYKDQGTARNLAFNGVPTWKEYCRMRLWDNLT
jgi:hypothetical protein